MSIEHWSGGSLSASTMFSSIQVFQSLLYYMHAKTRNTGRHAHNKQMQSDAAKAAPLIWALGVIQMLTCPYSDPHETKAGGKIRPWTMGWTPPHSTGIDVPNWDCDISVNDKDESTMEINRVGVDLAKNVFQLHGADRRGKLSGNDSYQEINGWRFYVTRSNPDPTLAWKPVPVPTTGPGS